MFTHEILAIAPPMLDGERTSDTFTPYLLKLPTEVRFQIYDLVFDKETLDPFNHDMLKPVDKPSVYLTTIGQVGPRQFFRYMHINQAIRADVIELVFSRIIVTVDLYTLVCVLQLLTPGMRRNVQHLRIIGDFSNDFGEQNVAWLRGTCASRFPYLDLSDHGTSDTGVRCMGLKDMLHVHRGLPNLSSLVLYPHNRMVGLSRSVVGVTLEELLGFKVIRLFPELRRLRRFSVDYHLFDVLVPSCETYGTIKQIAEELLRQKGLLQEAEQWIRAVAVEKDSESSRTF